MLKDAMGGYVFTSFEKQCLLAHFKGEPIGSLVTSQAQYDLIKDFAYRLEKDLKHI